MSHLTPTQQEVAQFLPATYAEISERFGFTESSARDHISAIERSTAPLSNRQLDGGTKEFFVEDPMTDRGVPENRSQINKTKKTRRANKHLRGLTNRLERLMEGTEPAYYDADLDPSNETVVMHWTDDHVGDVVTDEFGEEIFNLEIAERRIRQRTQNAFRLVERQESAGYQFDEMVIGIGGDSVTGAGIYEGQAHEVEANLNEQIDLVVELYLEQIKRAAEKFPSVRVICQTGNHGEIRVSGSSQKANADDIVYRMLDIAVREGEYDNITFIRNEHTGYTNFRMRVDEEEDREKAEALGLDDVSELPTEYQSGHRAHLRHGDNCQEHIGTSASKRDWRGWKIDSGFDIAYRGHYHQPSQDYVREAPVIMSGSIKPPSDFEESISEWSMPSATIHGVSDNRPVTWSFDVDFTA